MVLMHEQPNVPYGYCHCGCGGKTELAFQTSSYRGYVKGEPYRFIAGHHKYKSPVEYVIAECGYDTPCWVWQRATVKGYGYRWTDGLGSTYAHIQNWISKYGPVPDGHELDHLCRNRGCVNPDHLEPVPHVINVRRGRATKLTQEDVDAIRRSSLSCTAIGRVYGVHNSTITRIRNFERWKPVLPMEKAAERLRQAVR